MRTRHAWWITAQVIAALMFLSSLTPWIEYEVFLDPGVFDIVESGATNRIVLSLSMIYGLAFLAWGAGGLERGSLVVALVASSGSLAASLYDLTHLRQIAESRTSFEVIHYGMGAGLPMAIFFSLCATVLTLSALANHSRTRDW
jgi:hypothetical protein